MDNAMDIVSAKERAQQYRFLASVYLTPPTGPLIDELRKLGVADEGADLETMVQEYNDLFVVPLGRYTTPYEAIYRDEREVAGQKVRGLMMGPSTVDVINQYKSAGARLAAGTGEIPDHIGVELAFMGFLCEREDEARRDGDTAGIGDLLGRQHRFLRQHLCTWVSLLAGKIRENGRLCIYKKLATLTEESVKDDSDYLERSVCSNS